MTSQHQTLFLVFVFLYFYSLFSFCLLWRVSEFFQKSSTIFTFRCPSATSVTSDQTRPVKLQNSHSLLCLVLGGGHWVTQQGTGIELPERLKIINTISSLRKSSWYMINAPPLPRINYKCLQKINYKSPSKRECWWLYNVYSAAGKRTLSFSTIFLQNSRFFILIPFIKYKFKFK